jgi:transcriptional regulator
MYIPKYFEVTDRETLFDFIDAHSFGTLVGTVEGSLFATHLPLLVDRGRGLLLGHVAMGNRHWRAFNSQGEALAIFEGPHAYVSPRWYATSPAVPTWNYAVVHVYGRPRTMEEPALAALVDRLSALYDPEYAAVGALPDEFKNRLLKGIVGFELPIDRLEGKFKLGQNRPEGDVLGMLDNLAASDDPTARELGSFTKAHLGR